MEYIILGLLILILGVSAIIMASKSKRGTTIINQGGINVDIQKLAEQTAEAVGKVIARELAETIKSLISGGYHRQVDDTTISMNESVIPVNVDTSQIEINLEGMAKEEIKVDKDLKKSQSKLKGILGKNKKRD